VDEVDEPAKEVGVGLGQHPVAEVEDVAGPAGLRSRIWAEGDLAACQQEMQDAASDAKRLPEAYEKLQNTQARVEELYARWAEVEAKVAK
jgi:hypothetical protein